MSRLKDLQYAKAVAAFVAFVVIDDLPVRPREICVLWHQNERSLQCCTVGSHSAGMNIPFQRRLAQRSSSIRVSPARSIARPAFFPAASSSARFTATFASCTL